MVDLSRRGLLTGLGAVVAAPAIVRASSLMGMPRGSLWFKNDTWHNNVWAQKTPDEILADIDAMFRKLLEQSAFTPIPYTNDPWTIGGKPIGLL